VFERRIGRRGNLGAVAVDARGDPWFVEEGRDGIGYMNAAGHVRRFRRGIPHDSELLDIAAGPNGRMWFTDYTGRIGRVDRNGHVRMFRAGKRPASPVAITAGPENAMWFTDSRGRIARITTRGRVRQFVVGHHPTAITAGPDGALWFTAARRFYSSFEAEAKYSPSSLGRMTPDGHVTRYRARDTCEVSRWNLTAAPDGTIWFGELHGPTSLGRLTLSTTR
jgi:virginiamycin B lyase